MQIEIGVCPRFHREIVADIAILSNSELKKLIIMGVEREISNRLKKPSDQVIVEMKAIVAKHSLKLEDVIASAAKRKSRKFATRKSTTSKTKKPAATVGNVPYRHPGNASLTWTGDCGHQPQGVKDWRAAGHHIGEARLISE
ncbi:MAG: H-NS histone family protein [Sulfuritalea sp.]|nr:H-NS histone family protein [Sulfuritalea sp.]